MSRSYGLPFSISLRICCCAHVLFVAPALGQQPPPVPSQAEIVGHEEPSQLLISSYLSGRNLPLEERIYLLTLLSDTAVTIEPSLTRLWSQEAFQLAFTLPLHWDRVAHEKNALTSLAEVDPQRAFELFDSMDATVPFPSGDVPEDLRAYGARTIFREYWKRKGHDALDAVRQQALRLGDTGQYPFLAMAPIMRDLDRRDHSQAQALIAEAVTYYGRGRKTGSTDDEFSKFLAEVWDIIPRDLRLRALQALVTHLTEESKTRAGQVFLGRSYFENGVVEFRTPAQKLLFSLLPRIRELDPRWALQIIDGDPVLRQALAVPGEKVSSEELTILNASGLSSTEIIAAQALSFQRQKLDRISRTASTDPDGALELSKSLTDRALRAQALAFVAAAFASKDPDRARSLIEQVGDELDSMGKIKDRVAVLAALAKAAGANHNHELFTQTLERGFDLGEELFSEDREIHPGKTVDEVSGFGALSDLTAAGMKYSAQITVRRVERISNDLLRAHLLMVAAENLSKASRSTGAARVPR